MISNNDSSKRRNERETMKKDSTMKRAISENIKELGTKHTKIILNSNGAYEQFNRSQENLL
jgi:glutamine synthetase type III